MSQQYEVTIKAAGEVRDKDGNLLSTSEDGTLGPVEIVFEKQVISEEMAVAMGLIEPDDKEDTT